MADRPVLVPVVAGVTTIANERVEVTTPDDHAPEEYRTPPIARPVAAEANYGAPESVSPAGHSAEQRYSAEPVGYPTDRAPFFVDRANFPAGSPRVPSGYPPVPSEYPEPHASRVDRAAHPHTEESAAATENPLPGSRWPAGAAWESPVDFADSTPADPVTPGDPPVTSEYPASEFEENSAAPVDDSTAASDAALLSLVEEVRRFHEHAEKLEEINKKMHARIAELESDLLRSSLRPVIKLLAELHGEAQRNIRRAHDIHEPTTAKAIARDFEDFADRIEESLDGLGIGSLEVAVGDPFDRRIHQPTKAVDTGREADHRLVKEVFHQGFRDVSSEKPIVYAKVSVWNFRRA